jgi:hypothetical protein
VPESFPNNFSITEVNAPIGIVIESASTDVVIGTDGIRISWDQFVRQYYKNLFIINNEPATPVRMLSVCFVNILDYDKYIGYTIHSLADIYHSIVTFAATRPDMDNIRRFLSSITLETYSTHSLAHNKILAIIYNEIRALCNLYTQMDIDRKYGDPNKEPIYRMIDAIERQLTGLNTMYNPEYMRKKMASMEWEDLRGFPKENYGWVKIYNRKEPLMNDVLERVRYQRVSALVSFRNAMRALTDAINTYTAKFGSSTVPEDWNTAMRKFEKIK